MSKVRFRYSKTGKAKYISHLDLMSTMQRAFLRAGIELKYSEGFNPHPYMSVALPLQVGSESICELMDVGLVNETLPDINTISLPDGIKIIKAYKPSKKFSEIAWVEINATLHYNKIRIESLKDRLIKCFSRDHILITKRTKRGFKELDVAQFIKDIDFNIEKKVLMTAKISAQNPTLTLADLECVFEDELKPDYLEFKRIDIYDSNMMKFM